MISNYAAFLSYSHRDAATVRKLHSQLEAYRLPRSLGADKATGEGDGRLGKVFRDREDLSAASDLSDAIRQSLDSAQVLIVGCSPAAKASHWVGLEIEYFKANHPNRPIFAAILDGDPKDALPDALTRQGAEPLAADLRREGDGWKLGFLKLVSGMAGVPLDALIQRDSQRQMRRVMAVTGVMAVLAIIMGVMTTMAIQARSEAQFQRDQAEGLVIYMLDDLRDELEGVGRLDVMEGVNAQALAYFQNQGDLDDLPPEALQTWAKTLHRIGEDAEDRGRLNDAFAYFEQAHRTTWELLERESNNPERVFAHAQSAYWVGYIAWERRRNDEALIYWQSYRDLSGKLFELEPERARSFLELGYSEGNLCTVFLRDDRDPERAEGHCLAAIAFLEDGLEVDPASEDLLKTLANRNGWLARHYSKQGRHEDALALRRKEGELMAQLLADDPQNLDFVMRQSWAIAGEAEQLSLLERHDEAWARIDQAKSLGLRLLSVEPGSVEYLSSQFRILVNAAEISSRSNDGRTNSIFEEAQSVLSRIRQLDETEIKELAARIERLNSTRGSTQ